MRLQTKIGFAILPLIGIAIFAIGIWSVNTASKSIEESIYQIMEMELDNYIDEDVNELHGILAKNDLDKIESFAKEYQKEAFSRAQKAHFFKTGHLLIVNEEGRRIFSSQADSSDPGLLWQQSSKEIIQQKGRIVRGHINTPAGEEIYAGRYFKPWKWAIIYSMSNEEVFTPGKKIRNTTIIMAIICVIVGSLILFLIFRYFFVRPVARLKRAANAIAEHQNIELIGIQSHDEIGELAGSMEEMSRSLHNYRKEKETWYRDLENKIKKRTREIETANRELTKEISARKKAELELMEYRTSIESSKDMVVVYDRDYIIRMANQAFLNYQQLTRDQSTGRRASEVLGRKFFENRVKPDLDRGFSGEFFRYHSTSNHSLYGRRDLQITNYPVSIEGQIQRVITIISDITKQKEAEKAQLDSERMQGVLEMAGAVCHELNQPLQVISGIIELMSIKGVNESCDMGRIETINKQVTGSQLLPASS